MKKVGCERNLRYMELQPFYVCVIILFFSRGNGGKSHLYIHIDGRTGFSLFFLNRLYILRHGGTVALSLILPVFKIGAKNTDLFCLVNYKSLTKYNCQEVLRIDIL